MTLAFCPSCQVPGAFSRKRSSYFCADCESWFEAPAPDSVEEPKKPTIRVFLSYGHDVASAELVARISQDLEREGINVWVDSNRIRFGDDWRQSITEGIQASTHVLAFLSKHSTRKPGVCRQEIAIALGPGKAHVYTVLVEPEKEVSPPLLISHLQWLDMQQWQSLREQDAEQFEAWYQDRLGEILSVLRSSEPFSGDITLLEQWLKPSDCVADMVHAEEGFTGRDWLIGRIARSEASRHETEFVDQPGGEIEAWRTDPTSGRVFWITGGPGTGKSAVAARLAHSGRARVMAVHFCRHDRPDRRDAAQVIRSIAFQMATRLGDYRSILQGLQRSGEVLDGRSALELFDLLIANPLRHELGGGRSASDKHLIVLDALDETLDTSGLSDLLYLVSQEVGKLPDWVGLVVTSRPEPAIQRKLKVHGLHAIAADDPRNLADLKSYAQRWLSSLGLSGRRHGLSLRSVLEAAAGNFLYLRQLEQSVARGVINVATLGERHLLPAGLHGLYAYWFERRFMDLQAYRTQVRPLMELMLASREPLPLSLAAHVLDWDDYQRLGVLEQLGSLCVAGDDHLVFFHKSLRDWIGDAQAAGSSWFASERSGHERLARSLLAILEPTQALDGSISAYGLRHLPEHLKRAGQEEALTRTLTDFPFAMRRVDGGALEHALQDYRALRSDAVLAVPLRAWADCLLGGAHLIRRASPQWTASRILLQLAIEHADTSAITLAAQAWLSLGQCDWTWMRQLDRPQRFSPSPVLCVLEGHRDDVRGAQALEQNRLLSWSDDGSLRIWDIHKGLCEVVLDARDGNALRAAGSIGGELIWSMSQAGVRLWSMESELCVAHVPGEFAEVVPALLRESQDLQGQEPADFLARVCEFETRLADQHNDRIAGMLRLADRSLLTWSCEDVARSELPAGASGWSLSDVPGMVQGLTLLRPDRAACWISNGAIIVIDLASGAVIGEHCGHGRGIGGVTPLGEGHFVSWGEDQTVRVWRLGETEACAVLEGHAGAVRGLEVRDENNVVSWSSDGTLRQWTLDANRCTAVSEILANRPVGMMGAGFLTEDRLVLWADDGNLQIWNQARTQCRLDLDLVDGLKELDRHRVVSWAGSTLRVWDQAPSALALADVERVQTDKAVTLSNGSLVCLQSDGTLVFEHLLTGAASQPIRPPSRPLGLLALTDAHLLTWHADGSLLLWGQDGAMVARLGAGHPGVDSVTLVDQNHVLSQPAAGTGGVFGDLPKPGEGGVIWNWRSADQVIMLDRRVQGLVGGIAMAADAADPDTAPAQWAFFSGDGLLVVSADGTQACRHLTGHTANAEGGMWLSGGRLLSWSFDCSLMVWDAQTGTRLHHLQGHTGPVVGALTLPDGRLATWARWDDRVLLWDLEAQDPGPLVLKGHTEAKEFIGVTGATVSADGSFLSWTPKEAIVWDLDAGDAAMTYSSSGIQGGWADARGEVYTWGRTRFRSWGLTEDDEILTVPSDPAMIPAVPGLLEVLHRTTRFRVVGQWLLRADDTRLLLREFSQGTQVQWHTLSQDLEVLALGQGLVVLTDKNHRCKVLSLMHGAAPVGFISS